MESFLGFGFLMQIKASEFTELNMKEMKKKNNNKKKTEMILVVSVDWHYREKPRRHKPAGYFYGAFISIFSHEWAFRLVFRSHTTPVNPLTETLGWFFNRTGASVDDGKTRGKD